MKPKRFSYSPVTTSAAGLASAVADTALSYPLSATTAGDLLGHLITVTGIAATDHSLKTFTVTGTDANGFPQTEGIAGPNGAVAVATLKYFKTVTSVTVSATTGADTFNIGWLVGATGPIIQLNRNRANMETSLSVTITGTISVTVQHTFDLIHGEVTTTPIWRPHATLAAQTSSADGNYAFPVVATRLLLVSVTNGATIVFQVVQGN